MQRHVRFLLSSRNPTLRAGIRRLLMGAKFVDVIGDAESLQQMLRETPRLRPDFILMDVDMAGFASVAAIRKIRKRMPRVNIWVCSLWDDQRLLEACLEAGAKGVVPPDTDTHELLDMIHLGSASSRYQPNRRQKVLVAALTLLLTGALLALPADSKAQGRPAETPQTHPSANSPRELQDDRQNQEPQAPDSEPRESDSGTGAGTRVPELEEEEPEPPPPQGFYFTTPLLLSGARDTRLAVERQKLDDWSAEIGLPEMTVANLTPRSDFFMSYRPSFEWFSAHKNLNSANHSARLRFAREFTPQWVLGVRDSFLYTKDPTRALRETVFFMPRTRYWENVFTVSLNYLKDSRTKYTLDFDNTVSYLSLRNLFHILPSDRLDQVAGAVTASVTHRIAMEKRLTGAYTFLLFRELHTGIENSFRRAHNATVTYERGWEQRGVFMELTGGVLRGSSTSYTALGRLGYNWRSFTIFSTYSRQFAFVRSVGGTEGALSGGLSPDSIAQILSLELLGTIKGRVVLELGAAAGKAGLALRPEDVKSASGRVKIAYRLGRVFPFVGAEFYGQDFNPMTETRMNRSRYTAGVAIALDSVTESVNLPVGDYHAKWPLTAPGLAPRRATRLEKGELR